MSDLDDRIVSVLKEFPQSKIIEIQGLLNESPLFKNGEIVTRDQVAYSVQRLIKKGVIKRNQLNRTLYKLTSRRSFNG